MSKWRATVGLPTRTASRRRLATARRVAGPVRDPGAVVVADPGAVGDRGLGHAADHGAVRALGDIAQGQDQGGPEADPRIGAVPEAGPGKAVAEADERAVVVAGARAVASLETGAVPDVVRPKGVDQSPEATVAPSREVAVSQSIAVAQSLRTAVEADTEAAPSQRSGAGASTGAAQSPRNAVVARGAANRRSEVQASTGAVPCPRRGAGASLTGVVAEAARRVSQGMGATVQL